MVGTPATAELNSNVPLETVPTQATAELHWNVPVVETAPTVTELSVATTVVEPATDSRLAPTEDELDVTATVTKYATD